MEKRIYLLTGVPGVGKTSVARRLAERLCAFHIDLSSLILEKNLYSSKDGERDTVEVDVEKTRVIVSRLIESSDRPLIIDGHLASDIVDKKIASLIFVLRIAPWILQIELERRGYPKSKAKENIESELIGVCLSDALRVFGPDRVCEIDTTNKSISMIVDEAFSVIIGERKCSLGIVDWLASADPEWLRSLNDVHCGELP